MVRAGVLCFIIEFITGILLVGPGVGNPLVLEHEVAFVPSVESVGAELVEVLLEIVGLRGNDARVPLGVVYIEGGGPSAFGEAQVRGQLCVLHWDCVVVDDWVRGLDHNVLLRVFVETEYPEIGPEKV
jgi:hypothetical protein